MTTKLGERAAFPSCNENGDGPRGMSTRTWLAGMALQGLLGFAEAGRCGLTDEERESIIEEVVRCTDGLLARLEKPCA